MADTREEQGEEVDNTDSKISNVGHPLLNQVVASKIFEFVKLPELRSLRLVCKDWYSVSLPIWRRTVQLNIYSESSNEHLLHWKSLGTELDFAGEQPFLNFRLHSTRFLAPNSKPNSKWPRVEKYRNIERFWANYGHWIHKLELNDVLVTHVDAFKRTIFEQTPNLQELTLEQMQVVRKRVSGARIPLPVDTIKQDDDGPPQPNLNLKAFRMKDQWSELPFGWRLLFNRFPNIQKLELSEPEEQVDGFVDCVEEMLRNPARCPTLPITELRLKYFKTSTVQTILGLSLVKLKVLHADGKLDIFETAMQFHGNTLEELRLQNGNNSMDFWGAQVGSYPNLTELEMMGSAYAFSLHFLNKLPNLKVLRLEQEDEEQMLNGTNWTVLEIMPHLREFHFMVTTDAYSEEDGFLSEEDLEKFAKIMPNLECFTGQLSNHTLQVVCSNWRKLKELVILSGRTFNRMNLPVAPIMYIDDVGITGIEPGYNKRVPCVADLQELRHLTLEDVELIGDRSVFDGFLKLPHLSSLNICETNLICWKARESLKARLQAGLTITPLFGCYW